jgi:hypothetical protein
MAELILETLPDILYDDIKLTSISAPDSITFDPNRALELPATFDDPDDIHIVTTDDNPEVTILPPEYVPEPTASE